MDAAAALNWIKEDSRARNDNTVPVIIWGQSIGAGVASSLAAEPFPSSLSLKALILETPFLSIRTMLETLYPQKWLPYRYLWPFLRNHLDTWKALGLMQERLGAKLPYVLILEAGKDELVPSSHGEMLERRCMELGLNGDKKVVGNALHTEVMVRQEGVLAVMETIRDVAQGLHDEGEKSE
jgi:acetyl esterase/lipase